MQIALALHKGQQRVLYATPRSEAVTGKSPPWKSNRHKHVQAYHTLTSKEPWCRWGRRRLLLSWVSLSTICWLAGICWGRSAFGHQAPIFAI